VEHQVTVGGNSTDGRSALWGCGAGRPVLFSTVRCGADCEDTPGAISPPALSALRTGGQSFRIGYPATELCGDDSSGAAVVVARIQNYKELYNSTNEVDERRVSSRLNPILEARNVGAKAPTPCLRRNP